MLMESSSIFSKQNAINGGLYDELESTILITKLTNMF
jgi:hypothetical protein